MEQARGVAGQQPVGRLTTIMAKVKCAPLALINATFSQPVFISFLPVNASGSVVCVPIVVAAAVAFVIYSFWLDSLVLGTQNL